MSSLSFNFKDKKGQEVKISFSLEGLKHQNMQETKLIKWSEFIGVYTPPDFSTLLKFELIYTRETTMKYNKHEIGQLAKKHFVYVPLFSESANKIEDFRNKALEYLYQFDPHHFNAKGKNDDSIYYKKAMILINPKSGNGNAMKNFKKAQKILAANGIYYDRVITKKNPFVKELIRDVDLDQLLSYDLIICFSGDGIVHEVLNGFLSRLDVNFEALKLTIAMVPSGGGCALSENMLKLTQHHNTVNNALFKICHLKRYPVSIQKYECLSGKGNVETIYGFLMVTYGFGSGLNTGSEKLRFLSHYRFTKRNVRVDIPTRDQVTLPPVTTEIHPDSDIEIFSGDVYGLFIGAMPYITRGHRCSPALVDKPGHFDIHIAPVGMGRGTFFKYMINQHSHKTPNDFKTVERVATQFRITTCPKDKELNICIDGESYISLKIKSLQASLHEIGFFSLI